MAKHHKYPMRTALEQGQSYTWTVNLGGDLASMRKAVKHGQTLTISPITDPAEIQVREMVLVEWRGGDIFHLVGDIRDGRYLIINSLGGENGWVEASAILGRVTKVVEPEPRPELPELLDIFEAACRGVIEAEHASQAEAERMLAVADDMRWYADRLGPERWDSMPRSNKWSFHQNLWWLTKKIREGQCTGLSRMEYFINLGKQCVGLAAEIHALYEGGESVWVSE